MADTLENTLFSYSPIIERAPLTWPGGARVAVYIGLNVEHFLLDRPSTSIWPGTADLVPDALNYGWRDYGPRVGIWRMMESLDRHGVRASVLLNSMAADRYPQIIKAGAERDWAWLAHGQTNSVLHADMTRDEEAPAPRRNHRYHRHRHGQAAGGLDGARPDRDLPHSGPARRAWVRLRAGLDQRRPAIPAERVRDAQRPVFGRTQRPHAVRQGHDRARVRADGQGPVRAATRRRRSRRPGHGAGAASLRDRPGVPGEILRPGAGVPCRPIGQSG